MQRATARSYFHRTALAPLKWQPNGGEGGRPNSQLKNTPVCWGAKEKKLPAINLRISKVLRRRRLARLAVRAAEALARWQPASLRGLPLPLLASFTRSILSRFFDFLLRAAFGFSGFPAAVAGWAARCNGEFGLLVLSLIVLLWSATLPLLVLNFQLFRLTCSLFEGETKTSLAHRRSYRATRGVPVGERKQLGKRVIFK